MIAPLLSADASRRPPRPSARRGPPDGF